MKFVRMLKGLSFQKRGEGTLLLWIYLSKVCAMSVCPLLVAVVCFESKNFIDIVLHLNLGDSELQFVNELLLLLLLMILKKFSNE